eukprot:14984471-Alexandrium_andersonii.AAC.1
MGGESEEQILALLEAAGAPLLGGAPAPGSPPALLPRPGACSCRRARALSCAGAGWSFGLQRGK